MAAPQPDEETVLVLRTCNPDMTSHNGCVWPESGPVEAPDWDPKPECGHGLHGLVGAEGNWSLLKWDASAKALIVRVAKASIIDIGGKVKFPRGVVQKITTLAAGICELIAAPDVINATVAAIHTAAGLVAASGDASRLAASGDALRLAASGNASQLAASGNASQLAASGDDSKLAASGYASKLAASGYASQLAASGDASQLAASGDASQLAASGYASKLAASGDASQLAASGDASIVVATGPGSTGSTGPGGLIALTYHDGSRYRIAVGYVGEDGIKPLTPYRVGPNGTLEEAA